MKVFRNPAELNYRAIRDMGLAAWFGGSTMTLIGVVGGGKVLDSPKERHKALDAAMKASTIYATTSMLAYFAGTQLLREGGPLGEGSVPKLFRTGPESVPRAALAAIAATGAVSSKVLMKRLSDAYEKRPVNDNGYPEGTKALRDGLTATQALVPAMTAWLLFLHLKEDMAQA